MSVAFAYFRRDFLIWSSYRLAAFWQLLGVFVLIGLVYFAGTAVGDRSTLIDEEEGSYVAFILVGIAFLDVLMQGLGALPKSIGDSQRAGTFEPMLLAPITVKHIAVSFLMFPLFFSLLRMSILIGFGIVALGFWHNMNPISVLAVLVAAQSTFIAMGMLSAGFIILVKQGDPVRVAFTGITAVLGGVFFPVDAMPSWMQPIAAIVPLTHALSGIREGLSGGSPADVLPQIAILATMGALLLPVGAFAFSRAMLRAKREGSLGEY